MAKPNDIRDSVERLADLLGMPMLPDNPGAKSACPFTEDVGTVMSNFDHSVEEEAEALLAGPVYGQHAGMNFNARVWRDPESGVYRSEPWRFRQPQKVHEAATLSALMESVNDEWGWE